MCECVCEMVKMGAILIIQDSRSMDHTGILFWRSPSTLSQNVNGNILLKNKRWCHYCGFIHRTEECKQPQFSPIFAFYYLSLILSPWISSQPIVILIWFVYPSLSQRYFKILDKRKWMYVPEQQEQGYKISELSSASERTIKWSYTYSLSSLSLTSQITLLFPNFTTVSPFFLVPVKSAQSSLLVLFFKLVRLTKCISSSDLCFLYL